MNSITPSPVPDEPLRPLNREGAIPPPARAPLPVANVDGFAPSDSLAADPGKLRAGTSLQLIIDGKNAFPELFQSLRGARKEIVMEYFLVKDGQITRELADILATKVKEGVKVRFLYDWFGSRKFDDSIIRQIAASGVEVVRHGGILGKGLPQSDHRKLTVIDGQTAFTGGINLGDHYIEQYHDVMIKIGGPVVADLHASFAENWQQATGEQLAPIPAPAPEGTYTTEVLATDPERHPFKKALFQAVDTATSSIAVEMAYITDDTLIDKLIAASGRGVDVRLIVPEKGDESLIQGLHRLSYDRLVRGGVKVFLFPDRMAHTKVAVVDSRWAVVGSTNGTHRALNTNDELSLAVHDPRFAQELQTRLLAVDERQAIPVTEAYLTSHPIPRGERLKARLTEMFDFLL
ncbi:MAG: hypothetical protein H7338_00505 [Candidatus Sericytochromatia bacterium]|nr:hypothetical protein [Candidatus Sericytochromatia bacterium]